MSDDHDDDPSTRATSKGDPSTGDQSTGDQSTGDPSTGDDLFAPMGGWTVRILDLSGGATDNIVEEIGGFETIMHANAFARRYVRDSVELCRAPGMTTQDVLDAWFAFGEDAEVLDTDGAGWRSGTELADFVDRRAGTEDRDWRALDPRRLDEAEDEQDA